MNKRGDVPWYVIALVLAIIVFFVSFGIFQPTASEAGAFFSSETLKIKDEKCKLDTQRASERGTTIDKNNDRDSDGRIDVCDVCVCRNEVCSNAQDSDLDGMPDYCDNSPNEKAKIDCRPGFTRTKDSRCVENGIAT